MGLALGPAAGRPRRVGKKKAKGAILETNGGNGDGREREREREGKKEDNKQRMFRLAALKFSPISSFSFSELWYSFPFLLLRTDHTHAHTHIHIHIPLSFPLCPSLLSIVSNTPRRIDSSSRASRSNRSRHRYEFSSSAVPPRSRRCFDGGAVAGTRCLDPFNRDPIHRVCIRFERRNSSRRMARRACLAFNKEVSWSPECRQDRGKRVICSGSSGGIGFSGLIRRHLLVSVNRCSIMGRLRSSWFSPIRPRRQ